MAKVTLRLRGAPPPPRRHRRVRLSDGRTHLVLPITDPEVTHTGLADEWTELPRPGLKPLLRRRGRRVERFTLKCTVVAVAKPWTSQQHFLAPFRRLAASPRLITVAYGPDTSGKWRLVDATLVTVRRVQGSNAFSHATVEMEFARGGHLSPPQRVSTTPSVRHEANREAATPAPSAARTYTVKRGDTLWTIAQRFYGDGRQWPKIAWANHVANPSLIAPGQVLTIP